MTRTIGTLIVILPVQRIGNQTDVACVLCFRTPFAPNGAEGVLAGASVVFFSFVGFDTVATCAEECANPGRDLPIGIMGSLGVCAALYAAMCLVITGMSPASSIDTVCLS